MDGAAVTFQAVSKRFGAVEALAGVDLEIARGQVVALLGPNGAGKSTAIAIMLGLRRPSAGRVAVLGGEAGRAVREGRIGAMLQTGGLPPGVTVRVLIAFAARLYARPMALEEALAAASLEALADRPVERLSGGEAQRLRFALAIVGRPELVFLDEPTVGFDVETRRRFWDAVRQSAQGGTTVLFCTHYLEEADQEAARIVVLQGGRVVADGTGREIKARVAGRTVRLTWPGADAGRLERLAGVRSVDVSGDRVCLVSVDGDETVRALVAEGGAWRDLEVGGADLEEAFLMITGAAETTAARAEGAGARG